MSAMPRALFVPADPEQALRLKRFYIAGGAYAMNTGFVLACRALGYFSTPILLAYLALILAINGVIYLLLRSGLNRRFADPSLTFAQMLLATVSGLFLMYHAGELRSVFLLLGLAMCVFGMFRFQTRGFVRLSAVILAGYAGIILLLLLRQPGAVEPKAAALQWIAMLVTLTQFTFLAGYIGRLRRKVKENNLALAERNAQLEAALQRINDMAVRDELTGVHNRRYLMERLAEEAQRCQRNGSVFCICVIDIDHFKKVNDTYGHLAGDAVLRSVAAAISGSLRQTDFFGRFGGEEFLMVLTDTPAEGALVSAERARSRVEQLRFNDIAGDLRATISVGIAEHLRRTDPKLTIQRADDALYRAKQGGRNRCTVEPIPPGHAA